MLFAGIHHDGLLHYVGDHDGTKSHRRILFLHDGSIVGSLTALHCGYKIFIPRSRRFSKASLNPFSGYRLLFMEVSFGLALLSGRSFAGLKEVYFLDSLC